MTTARTSAPTESQRYKPTQIQLTEAERAAIVDGLRRGARYCRGRIEDARQLEQTAERKEAIAAFEREYAAALRLAFRLDRARAVMLSEATAHPEAQPGSQAEPINQKLLKACLAVIDVNDNGMTAAKCQKAIAMCKAAVAEVEIATAVNK